MLTLTPGCACDVCAEEYGPHRLPHSIPCGHVLCANCCTTIVEKTNPRLSPVCPFCREPFAGDAMRVIRMDFATSGWTTPRRVPALEGLTDINSTLLQRKTANLFSGAGATRSRIEVRRLEDKVSRIAAKKCSVEEVNALYKELEEWLLAEKDEQTNSLFLSAALLRAILMNHVAHSEASKAAKTSDANLRNKISDLEQNNTRLDAELRRQVSYFRPSITHPQPADGVAPLVPSLSRRVFQRANCKQLQTEVNQLRALASTVSSDPSSTQSSTPFPYSSSSHTTSTTSPATSPTPYSAAQSHYPSSSASASANPTPLARFNMLHARSASMSSRPATPASIALAHSSHPISPPRSHTPAAPPRSHTPGPTSSASASASASASSPMRSHTPAPRSHTPGPTSSASASSASPMRSHTPAPRSHTPGPGISPARSHTPAPGLSSASAAAAAHAAHARSHTPASFGYSAARNVGSGAGGGVPPMPSMPTRYTPAPGPPVSPSAGMGFASSGLGHGLGLGLSSGLTSGMGSGGLGMSGGGGMGGAGGGMGNGNSLFRSQTPAPPALVPPKPRRLSLSGSPPRALARSASEEKAEAFVRWLPPSLNVGGEYEYGKHARSASRAGR